MQTLSMDAARLDPALADLCERGLIRAIEGPEGTEYESHWRSAFRAVSTASTELFDARTSNHVD